MNDSSDKPAIVKLGGSLMPGRRFAAWMDCVTESPGPSVVVPGGGVFADTVRDTQIDAAFSDAAAHDMAILAMQQFGIVLCDYAARAGRATTLHALAAADTAGIQVWLPDPRELRNHGDIELSWRTTGDTLAVWLAAQLGATDVAIVKSCPARALATSWADLSESGVIDPLCVALADRRRIQLRVFGDGEEMKLQQALRRRVSASK